MLLANKSKSHKIKEAEKDYYHVLISREIHDSENKRYVTQKSIQIFDEKGFKQFKNFKPADITGVEILHDPKFKVVPNKNNKS